MTGEGAKEVFVRSVKQSLTKKSNRIEKIEELGVWGRGVVGGVGNFRNVTRI